MITEKAGILEALDQRSLLLPERVHEALDANARLKYYLTLLQLACAHADVPEAPAADLSGERRRVGIDDPALDAVVEGARLDPGGGYRVPRLQELLSAVDSDLERMVVPVALADGQPAAEWRRRLEAIRARERELVPGHALSNEALAWLTSAESSADGPHRLCLDLHKAVDDVEVRLATGAVDGARVFGLTGDDRSLVAAFMRGVHRTERLKFGHPGLGTTATRAGQRLIVENDVGATDAHVVVITIEGLRAVVTTSDVHVQRLAFLQRMLARYPVVWDEMRSRRAHGLSQDEFYLCSGTFEAGDRGALAGFLENLGSRLVFLIDWNKARKALQAFVPKSSAVPLLQQAAEDEVGHRAFLELGGEQLIYDAMAAVIRTPLRFGERLEDAIGLRPAGAFLGCVLRETAEGLRDGRSRSLIRERVLALLATAFAAAGERLVEPVRRHAAIVADLASTAATLCGFEGAVDRHEMAARAKGREREADGIVVEVRSLVERIPEERAFERIAEAADDAADELEEAIFALTLLPARFVPQSDLRASLDRLVSLARDGASAWTTCLDSVPRRAGGPAAGDVQSFLAAVDRVVTVEREADEAQRHTLAVLMGREGIDAAVLVALIRVVERLEAATDALLHAALTLRDHALGAVMKEW